MFVGSARLELRMPENTSLKDKRRVVKSLTDRIRRKFNIAVAEVDEMDSWHHGVLGLACVTAEASRAEQVLATVIEWIDQQTQGKVVRYETNLW